MSQEALALAVHPGPLCSRAVHAILSLQQGFASGWPYLLKGVWRACPRGDPANPPPKEGLLTVHSQAWVRWARLPWALERPQPSSVEQTGASRVSLELPTGPGFPSEPLPSRGQAAGMGHVSSARVRACFRTCAHRCMGTH